MAPSTVTAESIAVLGALSCLKHHKQAPDIVSIFCPDPGERLESARAVAPQGWGITTCLSQTRDRPWTHSPAKCRPPVVLSRISDICNTT
ncbi:Uncharacterised protein [Mycobacteroides abscessus subsp. abscessus]|nr:Uncharacterised protein [Mycobacteroides abscessus subsp. abscessus]